MWENNHDIIREWWNTINRHSPTQRRQAAGRQAVRQTLSSSMSSLRHRNLAPWRQSASPSVIQPTNQRNATLTLGSWRLVSSSWPSRWLAVAVINGLRGVVFRLDFVRSFPRYYDETMRRLPHPGWFVQWNRGQRVENERTQQISDSMASDALSENSATTRWERWTDEPMVPRGVSS